MTFNPNIPQPNDDPTASQADLLGNFGKLNSDWAVNHTPLTSGGNNGFHKFLQFPTGLVADPPVTGQQSAVYPKMVSGLAQLFFRNSSKIYQMTQLPISSAGTDRGFTSPWGLIFNAGSIASGVTSVTFAVPFTTAVYTIQLQAQGGSPNINTNYTVATTSLTGFTLNTLSNTNFYYIAIGV